MPMTGACRTTLALLLLLAGAAGAGGQEAPNPEERKPPSPVVQEPVFVALVDLRIADGELVVVADGAPLGFPVSEIDKTSVDCGTLPPVTRDTLKGALECAIGRRLSGAEFAEGTAPTIDQQALAVTAVSESLPSLRKLSSMRAISDRGSVVVALTIQTAMLRTVTQTTTTSCASPEQFEIESTSLTHQLVTGRKPTFKVTETARKSRIEADFEAFVALAGQFLRGAPTESAVGAVERATRECTTKTTKTTLTDTSKTTAWMLAKSIPLAVKRATVGVEATLPAVAPALIAMTAKESPTAVEEWTKEAAATARLEAQLEAEKKILGRLDRCPPKDADRFDPLQLIVCDLGKGSSESTSAVVSAVQALTQSPAPEKTVLLRWVVEHKTGRAREIALAALAPLPSPGPPPANEPAAGKEAKQTVQFLSGPLEHWSISADVFTTRETLFNTDDEGTVVLDGTPPVFYVSLNFLFGDQASEKRSLVENIELKWLMQASDSPFDSLGFGVGLRGKYAKRFGLDFDLLSPFVAWTWTEAEDDGAARVRQFRFGVSLSINEALKWVK